MADITMCEFDECPMASTCKRVQATPDEYMQSWANFQQMDGDCTFYIKMPEKDELA